MDINMSNADMAEEKALQVLDGIYGQRFLDLWSPGANHPHYDSLDILFYELFRGTGKRGPYEFYRAFFAAEIIQPGDRVLDIGCGDGFITRKFLAQRASHVDAIDIEESAIEESCRKNSAENIRYHCIDAVNDDFPEQKYDVVVWDGAIGHFSPHDAGVVLDKIRAAIGSSGVFLGSESLGSLEGDDHLQYFESLEAVADLLSKYFETVAMTERTYSIGCSFDRVEAYWRCGQDISDRMDRVNWARKTRV